MKEHKFPGSEMKFDLVYELVIQDILPTHFKLNYNLYKMTFSNSMENIKYCVSDNQTYKETFIHFKVSKIHNYRLFL